MAACFLYVKIFCPIRCLYEMPFIVHFGKTYAAIVCMVFCGNSSGQDLHLLQNP